SITAFLQPGTARGTGPSGAINRQRKADPGNPAQDLSSKPGSLHIHALRIFFAESYADCISYMHVRHQITISRGLFQQSDVPSSMREFDTAIARTSSAKDCQSCHRVRRTGTD